jgi:D-alanine-D-alanine ligase
VPQYPVIVKPAWEGSSKGIRSTCLVERAADLLPTVESLRRDYAQPLVVEEFIDGDEVTVGLVGNPPEPIGVMRVVPRKPTGRFVYSLEVKRDFRRQVTYECLDPAAAEFRRCADAAVRAWHALGCRDVARIDFRVRGGAPYFLEANPLPGLNPESSDLVIMAGLVGVGHARLVQSILRAALDRLGRSTEY